MNRLPPLFETLGRWTEARARESWVDYWTRHGTAPEEATRQWDQRLSAGERQELIETQLCSLLGEAGLISCLLLTAFLGLSYLYLRWPAVWLAIAPLLGLGWLLTLRWRRKQ